MHICFPLYYRRCNFYESRKKEKGKQMLKMHICFPLYYRRCNFYESRKKEKGKQMLKMHICFPLYYRRCNFYEWLDLKKTLSLKFFFRLSARLMAISIGANDRKL